LEFVGDVASNQFCAGIEMTGLFVGEGRDLVEVVVVKSRNNFDEMLVNGVKVAEQAVVVEDGALQRDYDAPVVAVERLSHCGDGESMGG